MVWAMGMDMGMDWGKISREVPSALTGVVGGDCDGDGMGRTLPGDTPCLFGTGVVCCCCIDRRFDRLSSGVDGGGVDVLYICALIYIKVNYLYQPINVVL